MKSIIRYYFVVISIIIILFVIAFFVERILASERGKQYNLAITLLQSQDADISEIKDTFENLNNYRKSKMFVEAISLFQNEDYVDAYTKLNEIALTERNLIIPAEWHAQATFQEGAQFRDSGKYKDAIKSFESITLCYNDNKIFTNLIENAKCNLELLYVDYSKSLYSQGNYLQAIKELEKATSTDDTQALMKEIKYCYAEQLLNSCDYLSALSFLDKIDLSNNNDEDNIDVNLKIMHITAQAKYEYAKFLFDQKDFENALTYFLDSYDYEDSPDYVENIISSGIDAQSYNRYQEAMYKMASQHKENGLYWKALNEFAPILDYPGSIEQKKEIESILRRSLATTVSVGVRYAVAIKSNKRAISTGYNENYQSNIFGEEWSNLVSISGFSRFTAGLTIDGNVLVTSDSIRDEIERSSDWNDIVAISVGENYIIGLRSDGTLAHAGHDLGDGQCNVEDWKGIISIATGWRHTVGLDSEGNVFITGYGSSAQLNQKLQNSGEWTDIIAIAAGGGYDDKSGNGHTVGLRSDGTVVAIGDNTFNQCEVSEWRNIVAIAAGDFFTVGITAEGQVLSTHPDAEVLQSMEKPPYVEACNADKWFKDGIKIAYIAAGGGSVIGIDKDGNAYSIGYDDYDLESEASKWTNILLT